MRRTRLSRPGRLLEPAATRRTALSQTGTVPHELNVLDLNNPRELYDLLFTASAATALEVAAAAGSNSG